MDLVGAAVCVAVFVLHLGTANSLALWLPTLALFLLSFALLLWGALRDRKTSPGWWPTAFAW